MCDGVECWLGGSNSAKRQHKLELSVERGMRIPAVRGIWAPGEQSIGESNFGSFVRILMRLKGLVVSVYMEFAGNVSFRQFFKLILNEFDITTTNLPNFKISLPSNVIVLPHHFSPKLMC